MGDAFIDGIIGCSCSTNKIEQNKVQSTSGKSNILPAKSILCQIGFLQEFSNFKCNLICLCQIILPNKHNQISLKPTGSRKQQKPKDLAQGHSIVQSQAPNLFTYISNPYIATARLLNLCLPISLTYSLQQQTSPIELFLRIPTWIQHYQHLARALGSNHPIPIQITFGNCITNSCKILGTKMETTHWSNSGNIAILVNTNLPALQTSLCLDSVASSQS